MAIVFHGLLFGLVLSMFIGPVFFALIQTSIEKGFLSGLFMAFGISLSDIIYIFLAYLGISNFIGDESYRLYLGIGGGIIMFAFGLTSFLKHKKFDNSVNPKIRDKKIFKDFWKGFLLNGINPSVLFFWISVVSLVSIDYHYNPGDMLIFFSLIVLTVLSMDILKSYLANRLSAFFNQQVISIMNKVVGIALVMFSVKLFYDAFYSFPSLIAH